jgi:hypothetical protein
VEAINAYLTNHTEFVLYFGAAWILVSHWLGHSRSILFLLVVTVVITSALMFVVLWYSPEPMPYASMAAVLVLYGVGLFTVLSDLMLWGLAGFLTAKRGEKWTKEIDYLYLSIGAAGIVVSLNRIDILTGRFERTDILAPLILATAIVIRFLKTRAEIAGWNKPKPDRNQDD